MKHPNRITVKDVVINLKGIRVPVKSNEQPPVFGIITLKAAVIGNGINGTANIGLAYTVPWFLPAVKGAHCRLMFRPKGDLTAGTGKGPRITQITCPSFIAHSVVTIKPYRVLSGNTNNAGLTRNYRRPL
jgi:hypothetical protein